MELVNAILGVIILAILVLIGYNVGQLMADINSAPNIQQNTFVLPNEPTFNVTLRWNHFPLKVFIDESTAKNSNYVNDVRNALAIWTSTGVLDFYVVESQSDADITVRWVQNLREKSTDTLGNTDLKYVTVGKYGLIEKADIELLIKSDSHTLNDNDMTNLALHEIGHAIGLSHSDDESDIMYPLISLPSTSIKKISSSDIQKLENAYSLPAKSDLVISNAELTKSTIKRIVTYYYANISLVIGNNGLTDSLPTAFIVQADGKTVKSFEISEIPAGDKLNVMVGNLKVDDDFNSIEIILDPDNLVSELNEANNVVVLQIQP